MKYKIKVKPNFLKHFGVFYKSAQAIGNTIWIPDYLEAMISKGDLNALAVIEHECTHIKRAREYGRIRWYLMYVVSSKFRLTEELEAIRSEFEYLQKNNLKPEYEKKAKWLSSWVYLKMISYDEAISRIN